MSKVFLKEGGCNVYIYINLRHSKERIRINFIVFTGLAPAFTLLDNGILVAAGRPTCSPVQSIRTTHETRSLPNKLILYVRRKQLFSNQSGKASLDTPIPLAKKQLQDTNNEYCFRCCSTFQCPASAVFSWIISKSLDGTFPHCAGGHSAKTQRNHSHVACRQLALPVTTDGQSPLSNLEGGAKFKSPLGEK